MEAAGRAPLSGDTRLCPARGCPCSCGRECTRGNGKPGPFHGALHRGHGRGRVQQQGHRHDHVQAYPEHPRPAAPRSSSPCNSKVILSLFKTNKIFWKQTKNPNRQLLKHFQSGVQKPITQSRGERTEQALGCREGSAGLSRGGAHPDRRCSAAATRSPYCRLFQ